MTAIPLKVTRRLEKVLKATKPLLFSSLAIVGRKDASLKSIHLSDLLNTSNFIIVHKSPAQQTIKYSRNPLLKQLWYSVQENRSFMLVHSIKEALNRLKNEKLYLIVDSLNALYLTNKHYNGQCELRAKDETIESMEFSYAVKKDSEDLIRSINDGLVKLKRSGVIDRLFDKYFPFSQCMPDSVLHYENFNRASTSSAKFLSSPTIDNRRVGVSEQPPFGKTTEKKDPYININKNHPFTPKSSYQTPLTGKDLVFSNTVGKMNVVYQSSSCRATLVLTGYCGTLYSVFIVSFSTMLL